MHFVGHIQDRSHFKASEAYVIWVSVKEKEYKIHTIKDEN